MPLVPASGSDVASVREVFRLQSQEDIKDAPVVLPTCKLLQTVNASVKRFYRRRIKLQEHGRVAILKDVLRQIGQADWSTNERMLQYLASYYEETIRRLEMTIDQVNKADAQELKELFASAKSVPCLDGVWRRSEQCTAAWRAGKRLNEQGWPRSRLAWLFGQLFYGQHVVGLEDSIQRLIERLHQLSDHDERTIAARAITSEGPELSLADRVKLLLDNWRDRPEPGTRSLTAAANLEVPVLGGRARLADAEFFGEKADLPIVVLRSLAPAAVDLRGLETDLRLSHNRAPAVLKAFGVPSRPISDLDDRLVEKFSELWPNLGQQERCDVLRYVGEQGLASRLSPQAAQHGTVLVATQPPRWQQPAKVVSPRWLATQPPHLPSESQPALTMVTEEIQAVWSEWCSVQTFGQVFDMVLGGATRASTDPKGAANALYRWLEHAVSPPASEETLDHLKNQPWVLAQRGSALEFRCPGQVMLHPGERVLIERFWMPALPLPEFARRMDKESGFVSEPPATAETLRDLSECLVKRATVDEQGAMQVYRLVGQILDQSDSLYDEWLQIAARLPLYRAFRQPEKQLTALQLFIGNEDYQEDLSTTLLCLKASSNLPKSLIKLYQQLTV